MRKDFVLCVRSVNAPTAEAFGYKLPKAGVVYTLRDVGELVLAPNRIVAAYRLEELNHDALDCDIFGRHQPLRFPASSFRRLDHARLAPLRRHLYAAGAL